MLYLAPFISYKPVLLWLQLSRQRQVNTSFKGKQSATRLPRHLAYIHHQGSNLAQMWLGYGYRPPVLHTESLGLKIPFSGLGVLSITLLRSGSLGLGEFHFRVWGQYQAQPWGFLALHARRCRQEARSNRLAMTSPRAFGRPKNPLIDIRRFEFAGVYVTVSISRNDLSGWVNSTAELIIEWICANLRCPVRNMTMLELIAPSTPWAPIWRLWASQPWEGVPLTTEDKVPSIIERLYKVPRARHLFPKIRTPSKMHFSSLLLLLAAPSALAKCRCVSRRLMDSYSWRPIANTIKSCRLQAMTVGRRPWSGRPSTALFRDAL
jgi:hypothetical protein